MPNISELDNTVLSGLNHIDALLDKGPDWNYLTPAGNTIKYTFSITSGNEENQGGQQAFSFSQEAATRTAMQYLSALTGINFVETSDGTAAQVHLCNINIEGATTTGLCSWNSSTFVNPVDNNVVSYEANAYVYLDNVEWRIQNSNLTPGSAGYETLLHELGHMLGLQHPFGQSIALPDAQNSTLYTLMSYDESGGPYSQFRSYDVAALNWLYGGDGLGGDLGIGSLTGARFITGTNIADTLTGTDFDDTLKGDGGNDMLNGGAGSDTAVYTGTRSSYSFTQLESGSVQVAGADGTDTLSSVELIRFTDGNYQLGQLVDTTPPPAPTQSVSKNAAGYIGGNTPFFFGIGEAGAKIEVFSGGNVLGTTTVDSKGFWNVTSIPLGDGSYVIFSKATDTYGNVSAASANLSFSVDVHPPLAPTGSVVTNGSGMADGNQPIFNGSAEAGTTLDLLNGSSVIGQTTVSPGGTWSITPNPLGNGSYNVTVRSTDVADNSTSSSTQLAFNVSSSLNRTGTPGNDSLSGSAGNNALEGLGGIDTAVYASARANYAIDRSTNGFTVSDAVGGDGHDSLLGVERIKFSNTTVAIDISGSGGQAYRVYKAAFDRVPDAAGVGFWIAQMDKGTTLHDVAAGFMASAEFTTLFGANPTTTAFVDKLYNNVLHRPLDQAGFDFWVNAVDARGVARADVLASFSESAENQAQVIGSIQHGFEFIPFG